jgi:hypothetical protein
MALVCKTTAKRCISEGVSGAYQGSGAVEAAHH